MNMIFQTNIAKKLTIATLVYFFIFLFLIFKLSNSLINTAQTRSLHEDEVTFIERGKFFDWYLSGDFKRREWQSFESYDVPKFAELFYGFLIRIYSKGSVTNYLTQHDFFEKGTLYAGKWKTVETRGACCVFDNLPKYVKEKTEIILVVRKFTVLIFVVPLLFLSFLIGYKVDGLIFGLLAMTIIGTNHLFVQSMATAMGEGPLWFFSLLFLLIAFGYVKYLENRAVNVLLIFVLGLIAGLAISTKLNGGILIIFYIGLTAFLFLKKKVNLKKVLTNVLAVCFIAYGAFFVLNPYVWSKPFANTMKMLNHRVETLHDQATSEIFSKDALNSIPQRFKMVFIRTLITNSYYSNFNLEKWGKAYEIPVDFLLVMMSLFLLFKNRKDKKTTWSNLLKRKFFIRYNERALNLQILGLYLFVFFLSTTLFIPLDWDRYYIPYVFIWGFLQAYTLTFFIKSVFKNLDIVFDSLV